MSTSDNLTFPGAKLMQLKEWGYPQGALRQTPPDSKAISVIHITGNSRLPSAEGEATWRLSDPANQNSATFFVNRDGSVVQALGDPLHMAPWANGDVNRPDLSNRRIAQIMADGVNANYRTLVAIENVGAEPDHPITEAQIKTCAQIIAHYHRLAGVAINRVSVVGHYQLNSVTRPNCPSRNHKDLIDRIVEIARGIGVAADEEDPEVIEELKARIAELEETARKRWRWIVNLREKRDALIAEVDTLEKELAALDEADDAHRATIRRLRARITAIKSTVSAMADEVEAA